MAPHRNHVWTWDFAHDTTLGGEKLHSFLKKIKRD
jgi:hypothetical protein